MNNNVSDFRIVLYGNQYRTILKQLIYDYWSKTHIFLKSDELIDWQYKGYGSWKSEKFPLLFYQDKLIGFRGLIPAIIQIPNNGKYQYESCSIPSLFLVIPQFRGQKLGLWLLKYGMEKYKNYIAIASNLSTSAPMHLKNNCIVFEKMYRYLLPLSQSYESLLRVPQKKKYNWNIANLIFPEDLSNVELEEFWIHSTTGKSILALYKNRDFWHWRFKSCPIYTYKMFGGKGKGGIIVTRICNLYNESKELLPQKVLRILEIIPENSSVWDGNVDSCLENLLIGVSSWGKLNGCVCVEFYITTDCFEPILMKIGFKEVNYNSNNKYLDICSYFEPCCNSERLSNVNIYIPNLIESGINRKKIYFTLSDGDQDRPNIIDND